MKLLIVKHRRRQIYAVAITDEKTGRFDRGASLMLGRMHARQHMEAAGLEPEGPKPLTQILDAFKRHGYSFHWTTTPKV